MIKSKKISKNFIGFLLASVLIWCLNTLSKDYVTTLPFLVEFSNVPNGKFLKKASIKKIDVIIKSTGFNIIKSKFSSKKLNINVDNLTRKHSNKYYFLLRNKLNNIKNQFSSVVSVQYIAQDTIFIELESLVSKKIPVKANLDISYSTGYDISNPIEIKPDSLIITGPSSQIKNINDITLETLKLENVKSDFSNKTNIILPKIFENITINKLKVTIKGKVNKFTEGVFEIPFKVINVPTDVKLNIIDNTVKVSFIVGLSNFDKINKDSFQITCDYNISKEKNLNYLLPKVSTNSKLIKSFKIKPKKIKFLIQK